MVGSSEDEPCSGDADGCDAGMQEHSSWLADHELKEMLLKKYSGCLSYLWSEFLKKRKKGKLPKDARLALMDWWNTHYRWPYPTEEDKVTIGAAAVAVVVGGVGAASGGAAVGAPKGNLHQPQPQNNGSRSSS